MLSDDDINELELINESPVCLLHCCGYVRVTYDLYCGTCGASLREVSGATLDAYKLGGIAAITVESEFHTPRLAAQLDPAFDDSIPSLFRCSAGHYSEVRTSPLSRTESCDICAFKNGRRNKNAGRVADLAILAAFALGGIEAVRGCR